MTDNEMRIAVAEVCGWKLTKDPLYSTFSEWRDPNGTVKELPDYPNDLNAMHDAVATLEVGFDGSQADTYQHTLWEIVNPNRGGLNEHTVFDISYLQAFVEATARQRCEAFLRTLGKFKD